jgi:biopolymer transport protein ExbB
MSRFVGSGVVGEARRPGPFRWLAGFLLAWVVLTQSIQAQETKDADAGEAPPAATESAPTTEGEPAAPPPQKSLLRWAFEASGPIGLFLLALSIYFLALIIQLFMELNDNHTVPPPLVEKIKAAIAERKFQEAYDACKDDPSPLAKLVRAGVAQLANGKTDAKEAIEETGEEIVAGMETRISYLATIGTLGPMIGLVGTIFGMILAFQEIANTTGGQPRPEKIAEGIATALFITLEGVALSIPAIFFFAFFRNRITHLGLYATHAAERLVSSMLAAAKQHPSAASGAVPRVKEMEA